MAPEILDARGPERLPLVERPGGPAGRGPIREGDGGGGPGAAFDPAQFGLWAFLGTVTMLFIGFTSAYIVRRTGMDWRPLPLPRLLSYTPGEDGLGLFAIYWHFLGALWAYLLVLLYVL
jgi:heme/copper-type cytochrome/quinol oxidase subunit 3